MTEKTATEKDGKAQRPKRRRTNACECERTRSLVACACGPQRSPSAIRSGATSRAQTAPHLQNQCVLA